MIVILFMRYVETSFLWMPLGNCPLCPFLHPCWVEVSTGSCRRSPRDGGRTIAVAGWLA